MDLQYRIQNKKGLLALELLAPQNKYYRPHPQKKLFSNRFTPLLPVTPTLTPRPRMQTVLPAISYLLQKLYRKPIPPYELKDHCPLKEKPYKLPLFTLEPDYC